MHVYFRYSPVSAGVPIHSSYRTNKLHDKYPRSFHTFRPIAKFSLSLSLNKQLLDARRANKSMYGNGTDRRGAAVIAVTPTAAVAAIASQNTTVNEWKIKTNKQTRSLSLSNLAVSLFLFQKVWRGGKYIIYRCLYRIVSYICGYSIPFQYNLVRNKIQIQALPLHLCRRAQSVATRKQYKQHQPKSFSCEIDLKARARNFFSLFYFLSSYV